MRRDTITGESVTTKNGYLLVKHKGKWKRRWVSVINGQLMYYKNWKVRYSHIIAFCESYLEHGPH